MFKYKQNCFHLRNILIVQKLSRSSRFQARRLSQSVNTLMVILSCDIFYGDHTIVPIHAWATRLCPGTFAPRHVCAQTRLGPQML